MNKLSIASRILVAFASGALIAVFFLPAWRIDLFAPQYPEGLTMYIWINNITGDVDIINGLNHYIGMKHITVDMFPEFKYLPYVVGFFMALGMAVAITGNRKFLFAYITLTIIGGVLAMYDFYQWAYDYGHNLDPKAPVQVPGFSYQPAIFGHKRLLNFDAYSFPDVGGWIVIGAGLLATAVWFFEWYKSYKTRKKSLPGKLSLAQVSLPLILMLTSCTIKPEAFIPGKDACHFCKMNISDTRYGGEVITKKTKVYKFDDLHCMAAFLNSGWLEEKDIARTLTINFQQPNTFIDVSNASFVVGPEMKSPMGSNAAGFETQDKAASHSLTGQVEVLDWSALRSKLKN